MATADVRVPEDYDSIQAAIDAIAINRTLGDTVLIAPGTYEENIILIDNLTLRGEETARVLLRAVDDQGNDQGTIIDGEDIANVAIRNLTFIGGDTAIALRTVSNVAIVNNVFNLGVDRIGVNLPDDSTVEVLNNTFFNTGTALIRLEDIAVIENNIFASNQVAISGTSSTNINFNFFYDNTQTDTVGSNDISNEEITFANVDARDFHLLEDSPAIDTGTGTDVIDSTTADLGAYGGPYAEATPFPPQNVEPSEDTSSPDSSAIDIEWSANNSYLVTHSTTPGGYRVYYDTDSGEPYDGQGANEGDSPIDVGDVTSFRLSELAAANVIPGAPVISDVAPGPQRLTVSWSVVANATRYKLYYGVASVSENSVDVGSATSYTLTGLIDGVTYQVAVSAISQPKYYIAVTAYDRFDEPDRHASDYSTEKLIELGDENESALSASSSAIPEIPVAAPNLPNEGCFIATAAFGYYDAREVRALRRFRDEYLLRYNAGRQFVAWYYAHSPRAAAVIREHALLRSVTRIVLWPSIQLAQLATAPRPAMPAVPLGGLMIIIGLFFYTRARPT